MHEEARERSEVQRPAGPQLLRERSKRADERTDRVGGAVGKRALGLDIEDSDDDSANTKRDCELGDDARQRCDVVGIDRTFGASWARPSRIARPVIPVSTVMPSGTTAYPRCATSHSRPCSSTNTDGMTPATAS